MARRVLGGRYTVQDKIGTGGMAIVYRGLDEVLGRTVAIKIMLPQYANDPSFAARFKQEAQAAAALQSPYIVSVYDWGKDGDTYYIVMEYLRGTDLKSGIRKHGALDCRKVAQIGSQIAQALTVAHRHDIIHRDIKPQNIMVQPDGNIKVMDFGIARAKNSHLTADNSVLGTAHYVSPEQTQGGALGPTTDIYSLGIVMYEAATGRVPFDGDDAITVALKQVNEPPMPPSQINARVDPSLESIILKCMQKRPQDRFQSADELYHVLRDYLSGRMQAVTDATISSNVQTQHMRRIDQTQQTPDTRQRTGQNPPVYSNETGHYHSKSATEQELERRHRRNVIIGVMVSLLSIAAIALAVFLLIGRPKTHLVPNLIGLSEADAKAAIENSEYFSVGTIKEEYNNNVSIGMVIDQDPDADNAVSSSTEINLVISKGTEPAASVTVPDLSGLSPTEAVAELGRVGLIGAAGDGGYSDTIAVGLVLAQDPAAGTTCKAGDTVVYGISKGPETVEVPNVVGWSQADGTSALQNAGFSVVVNTASSESYVTGLISAQSVTGTAAKGSEIVLTVSTGSNKVDVPNVVNDNGAVALQTLESYGFHVTLVEVDSDTVEKGYVVWQSVSGSADRGATIQLGISAGQEETTPQESPTDPSKPEPTDTTTTEVTPGTENEGLEEYEMQPVE